MLAFIFNFGPYEFGVVLLVAILIFGRNLPRVAVQAASVMQKMRRSLAELRRETGIDEELRRARRELEAAVPRDLGNLDMAKIVEREINKAAPQSKPPASDADPTPEASDESAEAGETQEPGPS